MNGKELKESRNQKLTSGEDELVRRIVQSTMLYFLEHLSFIRTSYKILNKHSLDL